ncbi:hypothetical protein PDK32_29395 [Bacillus cereus]|nr:hypothetical protein [Bacillus cereus]
MLVVLQLLFYTQVQLSPHGILIVAIVSTIILTILLKVLEKFDTDTNK